MSVGEARKISAVLIALNEERRIGPALASVSWADEILVVDGGSTDRTRELSRGEGARVIEREFTGFVDQKNFAIEQAGNDWVFSLDADERVSPALAEEIQTLRRSGFPAAGYRASRVAFYLGRFIRSTEWYPDWQLRLFDRRRGRWQGKYVHESVEVEGPVEQLAGEIFHYPYQSLSHHLERMNRYAALAARQMGETGQKGG
ncbi:MAG: glycosyltransferase family 2 protein, partial [Acidobacteriota bacterium]